MSTASIFCMLHAPCPWTRYHYVLRGWFAVDVLASFPFDVFASSDNSGTQASGSFRLARLLRLGRLIRVASFARMRMSSNGMRLVKLVFYLVTLAHWIGCVWYFISKSEDFPDDSFSAGSQPHMVRAASARSACCYSGAHIIPIARFSSVYFTGVLVSCRSSAKCQQSTAALLRSVTGKSIVGSWRSCCLCTFSRSS
eukprot:COSAG01_NODE_22378_length_858_cov_1.003953_2_plen_196_part_01